MGHLKWCKFQPVSRSGKSARRRETFVKRGRGKWGQKPEDRQSRWPGANLIKSPAGHSCRVIVHAKDERGNRIKITPGQSLEHCRIFFWLVETFIDIGEIDRIDRLHPYEDPPPA